MLGSQVDSSLSLLCFVSCVYSFKGCMCNVRCEEPWRVHNQLLLEMAACTLHTPEVSSCSDFLLSGAAYAKGTYVKHALILTWLLFYLSLKKDSDDEDSEGEDASVTQGDLEALISGRYPVKSSEETSDSSAIVAQPVSKWVCAQSSNSKKVNHNQCITEKLEVLAKAYSVQGDKWRALGYSKAINALKSYHKPVTSYQVNTFPGWCSKEIHTQGLISSSFCAWNSLTSGFGNSFLCGGFDGIWVASSSWDSLQCSLQLQCFQSSRKVESGPLWDWI